MHSIRIITIVLEYPIAVFYLCIRNCFFLRNNSCRRVAAEALLIRPVLARFSELAAINGLIVFVIVLVMPPRARMALVGRLLVYSRPRGNGFLKSAQSFLCDLNGLVSEW